jgi:hypothetical protein
MRFLHRYLKPLQKLSPIYGDKMTSKNESKIRFVPLGKLLLDNEKNPRLPATLEGADPQNVINYMVADANALELMKSIGEKDFFNAEPLLVTPSDKKRGYYVVVEGNRRLTAVMLLHEPKLATSKRPSLIEAALQAKYKPEVLPVIVYSSREEILDYLGYRHITGIKQWDALQKAKYLQQLFEKSQEKNPIEKSKELSKIIGSQPHYVRKLLCALSIYRQIQYNDFYKIRGLDDSVSSSFSLITTALNYNNIVDFIGLESSEEISPEKINEKNLKDLTTWIFDKTEGKSRVGESRNLKWLAAVVKNEASLQDFRDGMSLETAYLISGGAEETVREAIWAASEKIELAYKYAKGITLESAELKRLDDITKTALAIKKLASPEYDD